MKDVCGFGFNGALLPASSAATGPLAPRKSSCKARSQDERTLPRCSAEPFKGSRRTLLQGLLGGAALFMYDGNAPAEAAPGPYSSLTLKERAEAAKEYKKITELQAEAFKLTNMGNFVAADDIWTTVIEYDRTNPAAWSNRGNCRTSQGRFTDAVADFDRAIQLAPKEPDPHLGRGVALEGLRRFQEALAEYEMSNSCSIAMYGASDPVTFNNRGNCYGLGLGDWATAVQCFHQASVLSRDFVYARANEALALYQMGKTSEGLQMMEFLLRKYPDFPDMRAALAAVYWAKEGRKTEAENLWVRVVDQDTRYKDITWVQDIRRWPPVFVTSLRSFLMLSEA